MSDVADVPMPPAHRYASLQTLLLRAHGHAPASEPQLDDLLDAMDAAWDALSPSEQQTADLRAAALAEIAVPAGRPTSP